MNINNTWSIFCKHEHAYMRFFVNSWIEYKKIFWNSNFVKIAHSINFSLIIESALLYSLLTCIKKKEKESLWWEFTA